MKSLEGQLQPILLYRCSNFAALKFKVVFVVVELLRIINISIFDSSYEIIAGSFLFAPDTSHLVGYVWIALEPRKT